MPIVLTPTDTDSKSAGDTTLSLEGSGLSVPRGVEAQLYYNGLVMNDVSVVDKYRVMSIDGLDDADVRDSREDNPSEDGETAYDAFSGGRTIVLNVRIEAYRLSKLRDMEEALRTAFMDFEEGPLIFLTGDSDTDHYINCRKSGKLQKQESITEYEGRFFRDWQITLRASNPRFFLTATKEYTLYPNRIPNGNFESDTVGQGASGWYLETPGGWASSSMLTSSGWASLGDKSLRLTATKEADATVRAIALATASGAAGISITPDTPYTAKSRINVVNPGNMGTYITMRWWANNSLIVSADSVNGPYTASGVQSFIASGIAPSTATDVQLLITAASSAVSDEIDYYIDDVWLLETDGVNVFPIDPGTLSISNLGNTKSQPKIFLYGGLTFIDIENEASGEHLKMASATSIADGDFYEVDIKSNTLKDEAGNNKFDKLDPSSDWPQINPGANIIKVSVDNTISTSPSGKIIIRFQDAWK